MRIKNIWNYKKVSMFAAALAVVAVGGVSVYSASNAKEVDKSALNATVQEVSVDDVKEDNQITEETAEVTTEAAAIAQDTVDCAEEQDDEAFAKQWDSYVEKARTVVAQEKEKLEAEGYHAKIVGADRIEIEFVDKLGGANTFYGILRYYDKDTFETQRQFLEEDDGVVFHMVDENTIVGEDSVSQPGNKMVYEYNYETGVYKYVNYFVGNGVG